MLANDDIIIFVTNVPNANLWIRSTERPHPKNLTTCISIAKLYIDRRRLLPLMQHETDQRSVHRVPF